MTVVYKIPISLTAIPPTAHIFQNIYYTLLPGFRNPLNVFVFQINKNKKGEPVWVFLEREMRAMADKKSYNNIVGEWLRFLKDLKRHYRQVQKQELKRLTKHCGPPWFIELSSFQRDVLSGLKFDIHRDLIGGLTTRVENALSNIGITKKINKKTLIKCMETCEEDPGVFIWNLYENIYKKPPSTLQPCKNSLSTCLKFE